MLAVEGGGVGRERRWTGITALLAVKMQTKTHEMGRTLGAALVVFTFQKVLGIPPLVPVEVLAVSEKESNEEGDAKHDGKDKGDANSLANTALWWEGLLGRWVAVRPTITDRFVFLVPASHLSCVAPREGGANVAPLDLFEGWATTEVCGVHCGANVRLAVPRVVGPRRLALAWWELGQLRLGVAKRPCFALVVGALLVAHVVGGVAPRVLGVEFADPNLANGRAALHFEAQIAGALGFVVEPVIHALAGRLDANCSLRVAVGPAIVDLRGVGGGIGLLLAPRLQSLAPWLLGALRRLVVQTTGVSVFLVDRAASKDWCGPVDAVIRVGGPRYIVAGTAVAVGELGFARVRVAERPAGTDHVRFVVGHLLVIPVDLHGKREGGREEAMVLSAVATVGLDYSAAFFFRLSPALPTTNLWNVTLLCHPPPFQRAAPM